MVPLQQPATAAFGLVLAISAHAYGWPVVRGGTQVLADALAARLRSLGGEIVTGRPITSMDDLPQARATLFDTSPRGLVSIAGDRLPDRYRATPRGLSLRAGDLQARLGARRPDPVAHARRSGVPGPFIWAVHTTRSSPPSAMSLRVGTRSDRSSCSCRRVASTIRAPRTGKTPAGRTATCRTARPWT